MANPEVSTEKKNKVEFKFNGSNVREVLDTPSPDNVIQYIAAQALDRCIEGDCSFRGVCVQPTSFNVFLEEANYQTVQFECDKNNCPNPKMAVQAAEMLGYIDMGFADALSQLRERSEPILDAAEAARDAVLERARDEADIAYLNVCSRIEEVKKEIYGPLRQSLFIDNTAAQQ